MTTVDLAARVVGEERAYLFRYREGQLQVRPYGAGSKRGWVVLDLFSASAIVAVAKRLSDENRAKLERLPVIQAARVCLTLCK